MTPRFDDRTARRQFLGQAIGAGTGLLLTPWLAGCGGGENVSVATAADAMTAAAQRPVASLLPPNYAANTLRTAAAGSVGVNDPICVVRVRKPTFDVSSKPDMVQNVDLRLENVIINRT